MICEIEHFLYLHITLVAVLVKFKQLHGKILTLIQMKYQLIKHYMNRQLVKLI